MPGRWLTTPALVRGTIMVLRKHGQLDNTTSSMQHVWSNAKEFNAGNAGTPPSSLVFRHETTTNQIVLAVIASTSSSETIISESCSVIKAFFSQTFVSYKRLLYIATGSVFRADSPLPFGGLRTRPGYAEYNGASTGSLLRHIVSAAFKWYWGCRGAEALHFVAASVNQTLQLHRDQNIDILDELMLRGMKSAGHIDCMKAARVPFELRHKSDDRRDRRTAVVFTPRRLKSLQRRSND
ncbi:hypothetical protein BC830DRAFT_1168311 [Chytriomyces sp. MP71]|nr:hypothetical protein BC830DRAFT_1168311 [Chytriomyces sp. MP71]